MATVKQVRRLARAIERRGVPVRFVKGWEDRGIGTLVVRGGLFHHTAGRNDLIRVVNGGWRGLDNALGNSYTSQDGVLYIIARGVAWHAGLGSYPGLGADTSSFLWGNEAESLGSSRDPITQKNMDAQIALGAGLTEVFGVPADKLIDHKEWTLRKVDRYLASGSHGIRTPVQFRGVVRDLKDGGDEEMAKYGDEGKAVLSVQRQANRALEILAELGKLSARKVRDFTLSVDGVYGPDTARAVGLLKRRVLGEPNGWHMGREVSAFEICEILTTLIDDRQDARQVKHSFKSGPGGHVGEG